MIANNALGSLALYQVLRVIFVKGNSMPFSERRTCRARTKGHWLVWLVREDTSLKWPSRKQELPSTPIFILFPPIKGDSHWFKMAKWFRSEPMEYISIIMNEDAAHDCLADLGNLGVIQFTDVGISALLCNVSFVLFVFTWRLTFSILSVEPWIDSLSTSVCLLRQALRWIGT